MFGHESEHDIKCNLCGQSINEWFPITTEENEIYHRDCHKHIMKFVKYNGKADEEYKIMLEKMKITNVNIWGVKSYEKPGVVSDERIEDAKKTAEYAARLATMEGSKETVGCGDGTEKEGRDA